MIWFVDQQELAFVELGLVVLAVGHDLDRSLGHLLLDFGECRLGQREDQRYGLDLREIHQPVRIGRMNDVAFIDLPNARDAVDRRDQAGIGQVDLSAFDNRLVGT